MTADGLLDMTSLCALLGVKADWVYDQVEHGRIPTVRVGRQLRFKRADIDDWVEAKTTRPRELVPDLTPVRVARDAFVQHLPAYLELAQAGVQVLAIQTREGPGLLLLRDSPAARRAIAGTLK